LTYHHYELLIWLAEVREPLRLVFRERASALKCIDRIGVSAASPGLITLNHETDDIEGEAAFYAGNVRGMQIKRFIPDVE
jgi:hypothetical protein